MHFHKVLRPTSASSPVAMRVTLVALIHRRGDDRAQSGRPPQLPQMHSRMAWNAERLAFVAFHILHKDGQDLRGLPAIKRKAILWDW